MNKALVMLAAAMAASGQAPDVAPKEAPASFSSRTNLVVVPVVVRDHQGRAIGNLTKEDFQLFDKGKLQVISRFSVENNGEKAASEAALPKPAGQATNEKARATPTRFVAYVFDDLHLNTGDLVQVREAALKHVKNLLPPTDRAAVFTTSAKVALDFTADRAALEEAMRKIQAAPDPTLANSCPPMTYYIADQIQNNDTQAFQMAVQDALKCANLPRRAIPVAQGMARSAASQLIAFAEQDNRATMSALNAIMTRMSAMPGGRLIVMLSPGFYVSSSFRAPETAIIDKAIRSNIVINTINARGLFTIIPGGGASQRGALSVASLIRKNQYQQESASAEGDILGELADGTGGTWFHNSNDMGEGLQRVAALPEYEYILGFSPDTVKYDGSFHALKVTLAAKGLAVQARRGYTLPKHAPDEGEQTTEQIREALLSRDERQEFPITMEIEYLKSPTGASKPTVRAHVVARVDLRALHFRKEKGQSLNNLIVALGLFDSNGKLVDGKSKATDLRIDDQDFEASLAAGFSADANFDLAPGKYAIRLVVRDSEGQAMAAKNGLIEIP